MASHAVVPGTSDAAPVKVKVNWGFCVFLLGIIGFLVSFASNYLPREMYSTWMMAGASIVTLAAILSYIALFQEAGRKFAVASMLLFSVASPVLFFFSFMAFI
jgi:hypothetical protein